METGVGQSCSLDSLLHAGHVSFLEKCRELGTFIIVGLHNDWVSVDSNGGEHAIYWLHILCSPLPPRAGCQPLQRPKLPHHESAGESSQCPSLQGTVSVFVCTLHWSPNFLFNVLMLQALALVFNGVPVSVLPGIPELSTSQMILTRLAVICLCKWITYVHVQYNYMIG